MLSIKTCKAILERDGKRYSETQIKALRDLLYQLGEIDYTNYKEHFQNVQKSNYIHPCFN